MSVCYDNLPAAVRLVEVGPRDGWQNLEDFIPTDIKVDFIDDLGRCGFGEIEVSSFVSVKAIPQLGDATAVFEAIKPVDGLITAALGVCRT